jgi:hypothetical protein
MAAFKRYIPKASYTEPKYTSGGEYKTKDTGEDYIGFYIEASRGKYYSGKSPQQGGAEILKVQTEGIVNKGAKAKVFALLLTLAKGFFKPKLSSIDRERGFTIRYFIQDKNDNKIVEVDRETYLEAQKELLNKRFIEVNWTLKGPAENSVIAGYPYEGAASKNRKAITAVEKQMPGISTFVKDYSLLVEEPIPATANELSSNTVTLEDPLVELENRRKANFDTRK